MIMHVVKRGSRGLPIVKDDSDRYRYIKCLFYLNDANRPIHWERDVRDIKKGLHFNRPHSWQKERDEFVDILSYCLHDNHHHLMLRARLDDGITRFLQSLGGSMTQVFNKKYGGRGSIFQGKPQKRIVESDEYLKKLYVYINIKNSFERYSKGFDAALNNFDSAFREAKDYPFSSLPDLIGDRNSPIIAKSYFNDLFESPREFQDFARDQMQRYQIFLKRDN